MKHIYIYKQNKEASRVESFLRYQEIQREGSKKKKGNYVPAGVSENKTKKVQSLKKKETITIDQRDYPPTALPFCRHSSLIGLRRILIYPVSRPTFLAVFFLRAVSLCHIHLNPSRNSHPLSSFACTGPKTPHPRSVVFLLRSRRMGHGPISLKGGWRGCYGQHDLPRGPIYCRR